MSEPAKFYAGGVIFDGTKLHHDSILGVEGGVVSVLDRFERTRQDGDIIDLAGDILSAGYVDLQVNGGGGVMLNDAPGLSTLNRMARAHRRLGATTILPTLITDTPAATRSAIDAVEAAIAAGVPGIAGLHLEGPHLSAARKGAHDPALIRPMDGEDLRLLQEGAQRLPVLMITLAPESATTDQVRALCRAGAIISIGHSDAGFDTCLDYQAAGASCVTHLFNAMSQLGSREPGVVGAALACGGLSAGLIADTVHVHPETMRAAWAAKVGPGALFLVSDAMSPAGTGQSQFMLNGRVITRSAGRLTLEDGTLAGADLDLTTAVRVLVRDVGLNLDTALGAATSVPARVAGLAGSAGHIRAGVSAASLIRIRADLSGCQPLV